MTARRRYVRPDPPTRAEVIERLEVETITHGPGYTRTVVVLDPCSEWWGFVVQRENGGPARAFVGNARGVVDQVRSIYSPTDTVKSQIGLEVVRSWTPEPACPHSAIGSPRPCRCGEYTACCAIDLDDHVMASMSLDDGRDHG